ncbi:glycosyltransferase family 4 protein [Methylobacter sp. S3L5C]|uniref:glycosyltransferase family 4 protein n=1 Tax=Methylobacter sp. S3L5C TaxID=2839024 RepID=UPI001FAE15B1|nr:glycosyltransferase family 4 protein [Methylobacter sp. S3L5C]UOA08557.1 glycosyltransferase family 4 protein [Methylobacter sp. S3L5C]
MKILFIHNHYQQAGGEDNVVAAEAKLLADHGHEVELWSVDNKDLPGGLTGKVKTALTTSYSSASKAIAKDKLQCFKPDVVHVHNFFPQISPSIYDACLEAGVPVVQTLHNYRLICPGAMLMRDGKICEQCITGSPYQAAWYGCYRGSKLGSLVVAHMVAQHRQQGTWQHKVSRFIALTNFAKGKFVEAGFPADKILVKANFVADPMEEVPGIDCSLPAFALFVGRLSEEKGLKTLLKAWSTMADKTVLKVAGAGPLAELLPGKNNIEALGLQDPKQIGELMQQAAFLVLPSEWYEGFPLVLVEAFAHGLPVLASNLGSMADIIKDGETGLLFTPGDPEDLASKVKWLLANPLKAQTLGDNARRTFLEKYTAEQNYTELMAIYQDAMA